MPRILLTGANRGIGQSLVDAYLADGWEVIATCRDLSAANNDQATWKQLEITDQNSINQLALELSDTPIDVLWNNAGVYLDKGQSLAEISDMDWVKTFEINTIAPLRMAEAFKSIVAASDRKAMVFTSSKMASIELNGGGAYAYRSSKTALNMAVSCFYQDVAATGISCAVLHPGWVRTDMGGSNADIDTVTSATGMKSVVDQMNPSVQDKFGPGFYNYDGSEIPW